MRARAWICGARPAGVGGPSSPCGVAVAAAVTAAAGFVWGVVTGAARVGGAGWAAAVWRAGRVAALCARRGTDASGNGLRASAARAWAVTQTGVCALVRE